MYIPFVTRYLGLLRVSKEQHKQLNTLGNLLLKINNALKKKYPNLDIEGIPKTFENYKILKEKESVGIGILDLTKKIDKTQADIRNDEKWIISISLTILTTITGLLNLYFNWL